MIEKYGLYIVWVISCLATLASSCVMDPCPLDWYQRICLFPLIFTAGIAAWRGYLGITDYLLPQTVIGLSLGLVQFLSLKKPEWLPMIYQQCGNQPLIPLISSGVFLCLTIFLIAISRQNTKRAIL